MPVGMPAGSLLPAGHVWYFAYGSNMDPQRLFAERMAGSGCRWGARLPGRLDGWRLAFNKPWSKFAGAAVANIMPDAAASVHGTLNALEVAGLEVLDHYEGVAGGHYARMSVAVVQPDGAMVPAITYVSAYHLTDNLKPAGAYLAHLLAGRDLLPPDYAEALARLPCIDAPPEQKTPPTRGA